MKGWIFTISAGAIWLACATAGATVTFSPPVRNESSILGCIVENLGSEPVEVSAQLIGGFTAGIVDSGTLTIGAGRVQLVASSATDVVGGGYCRFEFTGNAAVVRGFIQLFDFGGSNTRLLYPAMLALARPTIGVSSTYSPPVRSSEGDVLSCVVVNLDDETVTVSGELRDSNGSIVAMNTIDVPPGRVLTAASSTTALFGAYCKFSFEGNSAVIRGYIHLKDVGESPTRLLFAASNASGLEVTNVVMFTPPVRSSEGDVLSCTVQNLSSGSVAVTAQLRDSMGAVVDSGMLTVDSGDVRTLASTVSSVFGAYCRFSFDGAPNSVRGFIQLFDLGGSNTRLLYPAAVAGGPAVNDIITVTPPVRSDEGDVLSCIGENLTGDSASLSVQLIGSDGSVVESGTRVLNPGETGSVASTTAAVFGAYCRFEADASAEDVRGFIQLYDLGGSNTRLLFGATELPAPPTATPTATASPTETVPATATAEASATMIASETPTADPTETELTEPTLTPTPPNGCFADCNGHGQVTVDELLTMVNIALGTRPIADCTAGDGNADNLITVDEIITAVNNALIGCG